MKELFLIFILSVSAWSVKSQITEKPINKDSTPVRGFYRNYAEYLNNSPSYKPDFTTKLFSASKDDANMMHAEYTMINADADTVEIWGFCDGINVFVRYGTFFKTYYWKLQCRGPNPYFYFTKKHIFFPLGFRNFVYYTVSLVMPPTFEVMFVDKTGRTQKASRYTLKSLLRDNQDLYKALKAESDLSDEDLQKYVLDYNVQKGFSQNMLMREIPEPSPADIVFNKVEKESEFPGGLPAWTAFLQKNLDAKVPVKRGAPAGIYPVVVKFIVSKYGTVSEILAETRYGYGMEQEVIRVIKKSMQWTPAMQNGQPVNAYRRQPVTFAVSEK